MRQNIPLILSVCVLSISQIGATKKVSALKTEKEKVSYIIGHNMGSNFKRNGLELDMSVLQQGLDEAMAGKTSTISPEDTQKIMMAYQQQMEKKTAGLQKVEGEKNVKSGKDFLEANAKKPDVIKLPSGLQYKVIKEGKGAKPKATSTVVTNYRGATVDNFKDGKVDDKTAFDSSYSRGQPASFPVNGVIKGWTEALQLMPVGSQWQLYIPSELAYGDKGAGPSIGPNATLIFDIELISIKEEPKK